MEFDTKGAEFEFDYESPEIFDIKRCLKVLYATKEGEQPLDRKFGLNIDFVGEPMPVAQSKFALEVVRKTAMYEPRVSVKKVTYTKDEATGMLIPKIYLAKGGSEKWKT